MVAVARTAHGTSCRSIGIMGYGHFGAFAHLLITRFLPGVTVRVYTPENLPDGKLFFSLRDVAACDYVVLAVPISVYESALLEVLPHLGPSTIIVDVATVKIHTQALLETHAKNRSWIALHPMFGPESYRKLGGSVQGLKIALTGKHLESGLYRALLGGVKHLGFHVVEITAREHDYRLAHTLFATHYFGRILEYAEFQRTEIDTVSFGFLMDAVESVSHDTHLFLDVFKYNPFCKDVLSKIEQSMHKVHVLIAGVRD